MKVHVRKVEAKLGDLQAAESDMAKYRTAQHKVSCCRKGLSVHVQPSQVLRPSSFQSCIAWPADCQHEQQNHVTASTAYGSPGRSQYLQ
jgi:hypothetical protein